MESFVHIRCIYIQVANHGTSLPWLSIHAANPMGGEKTMANARAGLGVDAASVSSEPYLTTAAPANAPPATVPRNATVLAADEGGFSPSESGSARLAPGLLGKRSGNAVGTARGRAMRQLTAPNEAGFCNAARCMNRICCYAYVKEWGRRREI